MDHTKSRVSDKAIVLARIDYGERDRIITVLTREHGKLKAIAKGVRSPKSKLAGGIELFAENHLVLLRGRGDLLTLTSSRMEKYFPQITKDSDRAMYAYECLAKVNKYTEVEEGSEFYAFLLGGLTALNAPENPLDLIRIWLSLKLLELKGISPNLLTAANGQKLPKAKSYAFDFDKQCFTPATHGKFTQNHIKLLRYYKQAKSFTALRRTPRENFDGCVNLLNLLSSEH